MYMLVFFTAMAEASFLQLLEHRHTSAQSGTFTLGENLSIQLEIFCITFKLNLTVLFEASWQFLWSFVFSLLHALLLYCTCHDTLRLEIHIIWQQRKACHFTQSWSHLDFHRGDWSYFKRYQLLLKQHDTISKYKGNVFCHKILTEGIFDTEK